MKIMCCECGKEIPSFEESITIDDENICLQCYKKEKLKCSQKVERGRCNHLGSSCESLRIEYKY